MRTTARPSSCSHHISPSSICVASACRELTQNMYACALAYRAEPLFIHQTERSFWWGRRSDIGHPVSMEGNSLEENNVSM